MSELVRTFAAQPTEYVGKRLAAEAFLAYGSGLDRDAWPAPRAVPADMPPICTTRSLHQPVQPVLAAVLPGALRLHLRSRPPGTAGAVGVLR